MGLFRTIIAIITAVIVIIFAVQNLALVEINFLTWSFTTNMAFVLIGVFLLGTLFGRALIRVVRRR
ncbi:MAG: DUF1049 domain-containing protein [Maricaulis sp.]|jgi:uncharacterized integral membrane protein|nr:DUF1049 domain-containing protein [Maricaulis sp.]HAQ35903.1 DUF1049 domain-containing protein [Alphaproteobacteria bacterium]|tara:strand:+ start:639 stop:836 length:198 start_codon:yes stop_codon:yes gene_type:complete